MNYGKTFIGAVLAGIAIGLGGLEELIKAIADDFATEKRNMAQASSRISSIRGRMMDEDAYNEIESSVRRMKELRDGCVSLEEKAGGAEEVWRELEDNRRRRERIESRIGMLDEVSRLGAEVERMVFRKRLLDEYAGRSRRMAELEEAVSVIVPDASSVAVALDKMRRGQEWLDEARRLYREIYRQGRAIEDKAKNLSKLEEQFAEFGRKLGRCPLCGSELK